MKDTEVFKKKTGIKDKKLDLLFEQQKKYQAHPKQKQMFGVDFADGSNPVTCIFIDEAKPLYEEDVKNVWERVRKINRQWKEEWDKKLWGDDEDIYDSTWRPTPEELPEHKEN